MGEEAGVTGSETGSECSGGDGAVGSTDCAPSPPVAPWSAALLEVLEAMEEVPSLLAVWRRAFLRRARRPWRCAEGPTAACALRQQTRRGQRLRRPEQGRRRRRCPD